MIDRSTDSFLPTTELTDSAIATTAISSVESTTKYYPTTGKRHKNKRTADVAMNDVPIQPSSLPDITAQVTTIEGDLTTDVRLTSTAGTTSQSTRRKFVKSR